MNMTGNKVDDRSFEVLTVGRQRAARTAQVARLWAIADASDAHYAALVAPLLADDDPEPGEAIAAAATFDEQG